MADISKIKLPDGGEYNIKDATARGLVVANPTLAGTESDLTGLQVGNTKYKVPSGGSGGLPSVTSADNGKVLMVVQGAWAAANLPVYNGGVT